MDKYLIIICGPTGVGKTGVGIELAKRLKTEIISADSRQIYKELSIGTAVPSKEELDQVKHHFIQSRSIYDYYNASMFENDVVTLVDSLFKKNKTVLMVGGSGLYIDAVCRGIDDLPTVDPEIREQLSEKLKTEGIESLRIWLKKVDPEYYSRIDLKNTKRILKALEIYLMTNRPYSSFLTNSVKERNFKCIMIGLDLDRNELYDRINQRVDVMVENGLVEEARKFHDHRNINSLNTVGYKEIFDYLESKTTLDEAIDLIKRNTRKYARRQLTWFRRYEDLKWFSPDDIESIYQYILSRI